MFYLIHQAGKVASQTLEVTICLTDPKARVERHHYLVPDNLAEIDRLIANEPETPQLQTLRKQTSMALQALIALAQTDPRDVFILSGFRDPLDFAISAFFQNLELYCPSYSSPHPGEDYDRGRFDVEVDRVIGIFKDEVKAFLARNHAGIEPRNVKELESRRKLQNIGGWFDREFKPIAGVDVFQIEIGSGPFVCFSTPRARFLIYRMETFRANLAAIVSQLPLPEPIKISDQNLGSDKGYAVLYKRFRQRFVPTAEMMEYYYGGRFFAHFYPGARPLYSPERIGSWALV
jgi:hypothetical protein